jgi:tetratricopeptide (TPR) repeat protein
MACGESAPTAGYTEVMARWLPVLILATGVCAYADDLKKERPKPPASAQEEIPPEEDTTIAVKEYSFNPLQAEKEVRIGNYYFHKGSYRAAAQRFREATKWNQGYAEAWLRLGEAEEKLKDKTAARDAYAKYVELAPEAKNLADVKKKIGKLK